MNKCKESCELEDDIDLDEMKEVAVPQFLVENNESYFKQPIKSKSGELIY